MSFIVYLIYFFSFSYGSVIVKILRSVAKLKSCYSAAIWNFLQFFILHHKSFRIPLQWNTKLENKTNLMQMSSNKCLSLFETRLVKKLNTNQTPKINVCSFYPFENFFGNTNSILSLKDVDLFWLFLLCQCLFYTQGLTQNLFL